MEKISLFELLLCLSDMLDLISYEVKDHHRKVSCLAYYLADEMGVEDAYKQDIVIAAALHDIGGLSLHDRLTALNGFEDSTSHSEKGYRLLSVFDPFKDVADIVKNHHALWDYGKPVSIGSQIVFMADRIAILFNPKENVLNQAEDVTTKIVNQKDRVFNPELTEAFIKVSKKDSFWLDAVTLTLHDLLKDKLKLDSIYLTGQDIIGIVNFMSCIIDFRSVFTATHSKGVSVVSEALSRCMGFSEDDCHIMKVAGLLHDVGKLAIPSEILEKNGKLDKNERNIIRTHAYYTDKVLSCVSGFETIREWASLHHESLNGMGYPFGLNGGEISLGSRIMKVSDVFVALTEERPYRKGMDVDKAMDIIPLKVIK